MKEILERTSVRSFSSKLIGKEIVEQLLKSAMAAPSAKNSQPWEFIVVDKREILDYLASNSPYASMAKQAPLGIIIVGNMDRALSGDSQDYWIQDCAAATENILITVEELGLGAVWTGVCPGKDRMKVISDKFDLPENIKPFNLILIGYPVSTPHVKDKFKPEYIHINSWK